MLSAGFSNFSRTPALYKYSRLVKIYPRNLIPSETAMLRSRLDNQIQLLMLLWWDGFGLCRAGIVRCTLTSLLTTKPCNTRPVCKTPHGPSEDLVSVASKATLRILTLSLLLVTFCVGISFSLGS